MSARPTAPDGRTRADHAQAIARELALVLGAALAYFGVRGITEGRESVALAHADSLLGLERHLGLAWETAAQDLILRHHALVTAANWVYVYGHWPVILACGVALYLSDPARYRLLRNAMFLSGLAGFVFFAFFPVAPPRLAQPEYFDTVSAYSHGYRALQPPALTNMYAAFPSLHAGWNLLVGIVLFQSTTRLGVRLFAALMPAAMAFAVVATGNHWVFDVAGGTIFVLLGLTAAAHLTAATIPVGERPRRSVGTSAGSPVRRRASVGELSDRAPSSRSARSRGGRGRRAPLQGPDRSPPSEDARSGADPVGPLEARQSVRSAARGR